MSIKVGDKIPEATFTVSGAEGPAKKTTDEVFKGKKVVLFAVPGAFTPSCHKNHLPSYVANFDALKAQGVDSIVVTSVRAISPRRSAWTSILARPVSACVPSAMPPSSRTAS